MRRVALAFLCATTALAAPARRVPPDDAAIRDAIGRAPVDGERYVSGRALEHYLRARLALQSGDVAAVVTELKLVVLYDPTNPFPRFALAKEYERRGQLDLADAQLKEALALERGHVPSLVLAARIALARGRPDRAIEPLRRAVRADPKSVEAFALLVRAQVLRRDLAGALAVLDRLDGLALAATDRAANEGGRVQRLAADALTDVSGALALTGRVDRAEALLRRALERDPGEPARVERLVTFLEEQGRHGAAADVAASGVFAGGPSPAFAARAARLYRLAGDVGRARAFTDTLLRFVADGTRGAVDEAMVLGAAELRARAWASAARIFEAAGQAEPSRAEARLSAGSAYEWLGEFARARGAFEQVEPAHPSFSEARARALAAGARAGDEEAIAALVTRLRETPADADVAVVLASVREADGDLEGAIAALDRAPATISVKRARARLQRAAGLASEALATLDELARSGPPDPEIDYERALAWDALGRRSEAFAALRRVLAVEPGHADAANLLAWLLVESNASLVEAEALAARALAARPDDPHVLDTLGWVLFTRGASDAAIERLRPAAQQLPDNLVVQEHLAIALTRAGMVVEARELYGRVLRLARSNGDFAAALRAERALETIGTAAAVSP